MGKGGEQGTGDVHKDKGKGDGHILVHLAAWVARGVGFKGQPQNSIRCATAESRFCVNHH